MLDARVQAPLAPERLVAADAERLHPGAERRGGYGPAPTRGPGARTPPPPRPPAGAGPLPARLFQRRLDGSALEGLELRDREDPGRPGDGGRRLRQRAVQVQAPLAGRDHRPLDDVLELADVAGPLV